MEEIISFRNKNNHQLFGILHVPDKSISSGRKVGINLLNPGLKNRVAPHRMNVKIARKLCDRGFYVLRFDPYGIGDSEGDFLGSNELVMDLWGVIQRGAFVEDTMAANDFLFSQIKLDELTIIGQCGGGVTAGFAGELDIRINNLILIDTPFRVMSSDIELTDIVLENFTMKQLFFEYVNDFARFDWLMKIFSKEKSLTYLKEKIRIFKKSFSIHTQKTALKDDKINFKLCYALLSFFQRGGNVSFLFAENDFSLNEFNNIFKANILKKHTKYEDCYSVEVIKNANHIYTELQSQHYLMKNIELCLRKHADISV